MAGCGCSKSSNKSSNIVSETILEGEFTKVDGVKFKVSMSATGCGSTCEIAKKTSQHNIFVTLKKFLE
jgi:flagellar biosynthesis/type III secretory pathway ATPase